MKNVMTKILIGSMFVAVLGMLWLAIPEIATVVEAQSTARYSQITVQNMDASSVMHLQVRYYGANGSLVLTTTHIISPYHSITISQTGQAGLPTNYTGSAVLDADKPFAYIVTEYNGTVGALGKDFWAEAYSGVTSPIPAADTITLFPQLLREWPSSPLIYNSRLTFQNTNFAPVTATLMYKRYTGEQYTHSGIVIAPGAQYSINLHDESALAGVSFMGTARLTSTLPLVSLANRTITSPVSSYTGFTSAYTGTTLYATPLY